MTTNFKKKTLTNKRTEKPSILNDKIVFTLLRVVSEIITTN